MKQNNFKKTITVFVLLLGLCLIWVSCGNMSKGKTISVKDYITIQFEETDYDGYATPELVIDEDGLNNAADSDALYSFYKKHALLLSSNENTLTKLLDIEFSENYSGLSNGDTVVVTIKPDNELKDVGITTMDQLEQELNIKFSSHTIEYKVSDLKEITQPVVELQKLVDVDFGKYNGYGSPAISINESYLYQFINEYVYKSYVESTSGDLKAALSKISKYADLFDISLKEAYNNTSNGDKIYFSIAPAKELTDLGLTMEALCTGLSIKFDTTETHLIVNGLVDPGNIQFIDLFAKIDDYVFFKGVNGKGTVSLDFPDDYNFNVGDCFFYQEEYDEEQFYVVYDNKRLLSFRYSFQSETDALSNGDVIALTININSTALEEIGYAIIANEHSISVHGLGEYLSSKEQLTPEIMTEVNEYFLSQDEHITEFNVLYFASINTGVLNQYETKYAIVGIAYRDVSWWNGYYSFALYDVIIYPDSSVSGVFKRSVSSEDTVEEVVQDLSTDYSYEKIQ